MRRRLTGRHVLAIAVSAFGLVIAANLAMLWAATGSFPGLVVQNSYVASQKWNGRAAAQEALGWEARTSWADGLLRVDLVDAGGVPVRGVPLEATVGRPTSDAEDRTVLLPPGIGGRHQAPIELAPGAWRVDLRTPRGPAYARTFRLVVADGS